MRVKRLLCSILAIVMVLSTMGTVTFADNTSVAKVDDTKYATIDEAIANWTHNTTLTLLDDVTLTETIKLNSNQTHYLNLSTYTITSNVNVIEIVPVEDGKNGADYHCLTITADENNPGKIVSSKNAIYHTNPKAIAARPLIYIKGGVFDAGINTSGNNGNSKRRPTFNISGGIFNKSINMTKTKLIISGGTFNTSPTCTGDSTSYRLLAGGKFKGFGFTFTADAANKLYVSTSTTSPNNLAGLYIDEDGYLNVGGAAITDPGNDYQARTNHSVWDSRLQYSTANANGLYWTDATVAISEADNTNGAKVKLYVDNNTDITSAYDMTLDLTSGAKYSGDVTVKNIKTFTVVGFENFTGTVKANDTYGLEYVDTTDENGVVTRTYTSIYTHESGTTCVVYEGEEIGHYGNFVDALKSCYGTTGRTIVLLKKVTSSSFVANNTSTEPTSVTVDLNGIAGHSFYLLSGKATTPSSITIIDSSENKTATMTHKSFLSSLASHNYTPIVNAGTWTKEDPTNYVADGYAAYDTEEGYHFVGKADKNSVVEIYKPSTVATIADDDVSAWMLIGSYASLTEALENVCDGYMLKFIADVTADAPIEIEKNLAIDLNNCALTAPQGITIDAENTSFGGGDLVANIEVISGNLNITDGNYVGTIEHADADADIAITGGTYSVDVSEHVVEGYDCVRTASGYTVISEEKQADSIYVIYEEASATEGEKVYNIVVKANEGDVINELASVDLSFVYTTAPVTGGAIDFTVAPVEKFAMSRYYEKDGKVTNRYMFNYNGVGDNYEGTGAEITVGTITVTGYGSYTIATDNSDAAKATNVVHATTVHDNLVDSYTAAGATDGIATTGALDISGKVDKAEIAVPTRELTITIDFPNEVKDNAAAYQDMLVEITGVFDGETKTVPYVLGGNMVNGSYVLEDIALVRDNAYTVTVSGAGYRTARYTVTMTENKALRFWNNVMDEAQFVEIGKESSKVEVTFLAGDIVKDNNINIYDLSAVVSYFGQTNDTTAYSNYAKYDLNRDGVIDSKDVAYVLVSWNN